MDRKQIDETFGAEVVSFILAFLAYRFDNPLPYDKRDKDGNVTGKATSQRVRAAELSGPIAEIDARYKDKDKRIELYSALKESGLCREAWVGKAPGLADLRLEVRPRATAAAENQMKDFLAYYQSKKAGASA